MTDIGDKVLYNVIFYIMGLLVYFIFNLIWAFPIVWAWNYTMTYIFGLPPINWLHAICLLLILNSLWGLKILHGK